MFSWVKDHTYCIVGGLYGENQTVVDEKFSIECHSDQVYREQKDFVNYEVVLVVSHL